jgi:hypothetical protein
MMYGHFLRKTWGLQAWDGIVFEEIQKFLGLTFYHLPRLDCWREAGGVGMKTIHLYTVTSRSTGWPAAQHSFSSGNFSKACHHVIHEARDVSGSTYCNCNKKNRNNDSPTG